MDIKHINVNGENVTINPKSIADDFYTQEIVENTEWMTIITDKNDNIIEGIKQNGTKFLSNIESPSLTSIKDKISKLENTQYSKLKGKRLLAIGDSLTTTYGGNQKKWQQYIGEILEMNIRTHAKGGIGIIQMVDGDGTERPEGVDPDNFGVTDIYPLIADDVKDVDIIIAHGFYNERTSTYYESTAGTIDDMYPHQKTFCGKLNYMVKRIYECLQEAENYTCKLCFSVPHKYGSYDYNEKTAYEDGELMYKYIKMIADKHSLFLIDCMHGANINMYNWNVYQSYPHHAYQLYLPAFGENDGTNKPFDSISTDETLLYKNEFSANAKDYKNYRATVTEGSRVSYYYLSNGEKWVKTVAQPVPWCGDQLHCSQKGYQRLGEYIAAQICTI